MEHGIQSASRDQGHLLSIRVQTQFQHTVGGIAHQLDGTIRKPSTDQADACWAHIPTVLCRLPSRSLTSGVVARTHKKGKAQRCFVQGRVTTTAITIHRKPGLLTDCFRLESALSRVMAALLILLPQRRSSVSSMTRSTLAPAGTKVSTMSKSSWRLTATGDHCARLST